MSLSASYLRVRPIIIAVVEGYIVEMAFANHPLNYTEQAIELAHKGNPTSIDAGELFLILTNHYLLKRAVSTAKLNTSGTLWVIRESRFLNEYRDDKRQQRWTS